MTAVRATVRLQFHAGFTLDDAIPLVEYFAGLGISHLYASPLLTARPGSTHGYDTLDYNHVNPELGGREALVRLVARLRAHGMGLIVDIVPNHMAVGGSGNAWWEDVLAWGRASRYAAMFDIDWAPADDSLRGRVLLPFLANPYGDCLEKGELELRYDATDGSFACWHYEHRFPICPDHYADLLAGESVARALARMAPDHPEGRASLHALLERQHYRLAWWRTASDLVNWRRFFDITGLAGLRIEDPHVFDAVHRTVIDLYADGLIDGVRIDHIDGLTAPRAYTTRLHRALCHAAARRPPDVPPGAHLYVEKILAAEETLPADWPVDGTTGYDFLEQANLVLHDQRGADVLDDLWVWGAGGATSFREQEQAARQDVLDGTLAADLARLVHALAHLARRDPSARDFTPAALERVLRRILIQFPVYRIYEDDTVLRTVCQAVRGGLTPAQQPVLDWLERQLGSDAPPGAAGAIACFAHLTAPLAAKAVEDTGFYRYGRLLSRNDVGTHPGQFGGTVAAFHAANSVRRRDWPRAMLATATHDHKRGEDARARLAVLSELAQKWARSVARWSEANAPLRRRIATRSGPCLAPDRADELILYQTLLGAWPAGEGPLEHRITPDFRDRVAAWQVKALREAKRQTSWIDPEPAYEEACAAFLDGLLSLHAENRFPRMLDAFVSQVAPAGALNGLAQTLLRVTSPGVPDLYQGCEFWDFSLVDPDNRRPVDYASRIAAHDAGADVGSLLPHWRDGRVKQALIAAVLRFRAAQPDLFAEGTYQPIRVTGTRRQHLVAFARIMAGTTMLVVAPRLSAALMPDPADLSCPSLLWRGTALDWDEAPALAWRSLLYPGRVLDRVAVLDLAMLAGGAPLDVLVSTS
ncbi:malto-oligosyltrehalose synthase [Gluconacetobacter sacchari]|uniref:malto-oligosyltrehalose synthase n=1 Tax=Gluconacetobacter sacchari TaxID=92759 RepID=UPI0039B6E6C1